MASVAIAPKYFSLSPGSLLDSTVQSAQLTAMQCRSRRPLSVDDIPFVETFLGQTSLNDLPESSVDDSFPVFLSTPCSRCGLVPFSEFPGSSLRRLSDSSPHSARTFTGGVRDWYSCSSIEPSSIMEKLFIEIYEDIGACWKRLGRHLVDRECILNNINADYADVSEKAFQMLTRWFQEKGQKNATPEALFQATLDIHRTDVAEKLLKLVPSLSRLAYLLDRVIPNGSKIYNVKESPDNFDVKKVLQSKNEKVFVCATKETPGMFVIKQLESSKNEFAARKCINTKALRQQKRNLRKTNEFIRDLAMKQKMVQDLLGICEHLQNHLRTHHQVTCQKLLNCGSCDQYRMQKGIIQNDLTLLHYELHKMVRGNRRISISGIPSDRIYQLARRTYALYEKHKRMHRGRKSLQQVGHVCESWSDDDTASEDSGNVMEGPLMCVSNIIFSIAKRSSTRTHKVSQSDKTRRTASRNKVKRNSSENKPPSRSRQDTSMALGNPVKMGNFLTPGDWSGAPPFKLYSGLKDSSSQRSGTNRERTKSAWSTINLDGHLYELEPGEVFI